MSGSFIDKKKYEATIFRKVYGDIHTIDGEGESPDIIVRSSNGFVWGSEITELFSSESAARLVRHPKYLGHLLSGGNIYSSDKDALNAGPFQVVRGNGEEKFDSKGVWVERPSPIRFVELLTQIVSGKAERCSAYLERCTSVDLIVQDADDSFCFDSAEPFFKALQLVPAGSDLRAKILSSKFREVYLVTRVAGDPVCISLSGSIFLGDLYAMDKILGINGVLAENDTVRYAKALFAAMNYLGYDSAFVGNSLSHPEIQMGTLTCSGFHKGISVRRSDDVEALTVERARLSAFVEGMTEVERVKAEAMAKKRAEFLAVSPFVRPCY